MIIQKTLELGGLARTSFEAFDGLRFAADPSPFDVPRGISVYAERRLWGHSTWVVIELEYLGREPLRSYRVSSGVEVKQGARSKRLHSIHIAPKAVPALAQLTSAAFSRWIAEMARRSAQTHPAPHRRRHYLLARRAFEQASPAVYGLLAELGQHSKGIR